MDIKEMTFNSIKDFQRYLSGHNDSKIRLFRGQMDDWPLESMVDFQNEELFSGSFIKIFKAEPFDNRAINQESWYSIQPPQIFGKGGDGLPHFNKNNTLNENEYFEYYLKKFRFKNSMRREVLNYLNINKINGIKVYPDLAGFCKTIEMNEI